MLDKSIWGGGGGGGGWGHKALGERVAIPFSRHILTRAHLLLDGLQAKRNAVLDWQTCVHVYLLLANGFEI